MGTPEFAVASLDALVSNNYDVCAVVTAPDRKAGRGRKINTSPVKDYALSHDIRLLQPENLKDPNFHNQLEELNANLFVVVAFRMLPEIVWRMPLLGTFNLHASLLPQYRGAAPINHTIINGEEVGGVSTFFLKHEIDTGNIIFREETEIDSKETAGEYHDRLKEIGAGLILKTVTAIADGSVTVRSQKEYLQEGMELKLAPKIFKDDCRIDWSRDAVSIYNLIRGLSPYPAAFTELELSDGGSLYIKIFRAEIKQCDCTSSLGKVTTDYKNYLNISCSDACISILEMQQAGKKKLKIKDFLAGLIPNYLA